MHRKLRAFHSPLAKYGFTTLALLAAATGQYGPAIFCAVLAAYAWRGLPRRIAHSRHRRR